MRIVQKISDGLFGINITIVAFMLVSISLNVLLRPVGHSMLGIDEICEELMPALAFFSLPLAIRYGTAISVDLLTSRFPVKFGHGVDFFCNMVVLVFCALVAGMGVYMVWNSYLSQQVTLLLEIRVWITQLILPLGMLMATVETVGRIVKKRREE